jgi:PAS domain S-box-containing protein/putative nucleotidyltransferase with HDIG domain
MAAIVIAILSGGYLLFSDRDREVKQRIDRELDTVSILKVNQIVQWRQERLADAQILMDSQFLIEGIQELIDNPGDREVKDKVMTRFSSITRQYSDFADIRLIDNDGNILLSLTDNYDIAHEVIMETMITAVLEQRAVITDFHILENDKYPHLDIVAPLFISDDGSQDIIGAVIFTLDPTSYLYPLVQYWPTPTETAETLLVRGDGENVLFLNPLRYHEDAALNLKIPLSEKDVPAVMAVLGAEGVFRGIDYRGVDVFSVIRRVPDSQWYMIAKIDADEALAQWNVQQAYMIAFLVGLLAFSLTGVSYFWQRRRRMVYEKLYKDEMERKALARHFEYLVKYANDIIILWDQERRIVEVNDRAVEVYGYSREEFSKLPFNGLVTEKDIKNLNKRVKSVESQGSSLSEGLHIRKDGRVFPVEVSSRAIEIEGEKYVQAIIRDISERKIAEKERQNHYDELKKTLEGTINAIAHISEVRDPYTSGHQREVSRLATEIAKEMGLTEEQVETIRIAGIVHDIGKLYVPAEILSKPSKLNDIEMELIKSHPEIGHNILKTVNLPWQISPIVLQHHERLNGSGYPAGLHADKIMIEAKILAVADVTEAMASHRPYRPALGIDIALEEISRNSGTLYDPAVVNVCLRLFREKGYRIQSDNTSPVKN